MGSKGGRHDINYTIYGEPVGLLSMERQPSQYVEELRLLFTVYMLLCGGTRVVKANRKSLVNANQNCIA